MKTSNFDETYFTLPNRTRATRILTVLLFIVLVLVSYAAAGFRQGVINVREAQSDNRVWNITQLEVAFQRFLLSIDGATRSAELDDIVSEDSRQRLVDDFDIFFSRVSTVMATVSFFDESEDEILVIEESEEIRTLLAREVDSLSKKYISREEIISLHTLANELASSIRNLTTKSLQIANLYSEAERLALLKKFRTFYALAVTLIAITIGLFILSIGIDHKQSAAIVKLRRNNALVRVAFESSVTGIFVCNRDGRIMVSNSAASNIFGLEIDKMIGKSLEDTIVPGHLKNDYHRLIRYFAWQVRGGEWTSESVRVVGKRHNGTSFPANVIVRKVAVSDTENVLILFIRDISEDVLAEQRLESALKNARKHAAAQERFLATMSHELRTPLHGVLVATDLMALQALPSNSKELVEMTQISARHALQQIDFALDAIRSDDVTEEFAPFDPRKLVSQVVDEVRLVAKGEGTAFELELAGDWLEQNFIGRPRAYHRALVNLVGNAAKFARGGHVLVRLTFSKGETEDVIRLTTDVIDDGPGILSERISRIFKPYEKWYPKSGAGRGQIGFGLGLWIAQEAVSMLGGEIDVQSKVGQGAKFSFTHPVRLGGGRQAQAQLEKQSIQLNPAKWMGRALVVDDSRINTELMAHMVAELGYEASVAYSGAEAVAAATSTSFDLILMDFFMPEMNGPDAVQHIRRDGASTNAKILGITARIDLGAKNRQYSCGMSGVLQKPFGLTELRAALSKVTASQTENDMQQVEKAARKGIAPTVVQRVQDLGMPLLQDTFSQAWIAVLQTEQGNPMASGTAHRVAGAALMLGLETLGNELLALEQLLDSNVTEKTLSDTVSRVRDAIRDAELELSRHLVTCAPEVPSI